MHGSNNFDGAVDGNDIADDHEDNNDNNDDNNDEYDDGDNDDNDEDDDYDDEDVNDERWCFQNFIVRGSSGGSWALSLKIGQEVQHFLILR